MERFLVLKGYVSGLDGWHTDKNGSLYAVIAVDEDCNQLTGVYADVSIDIDGISAAIRRINEQIPPFDFPCKLDESDCNVCTVDCEHRTDRIIESEVKQ